MTIKIIASKPVSGQISIAPLIGQTFKVVAPSTGGDVFISPTPLPGRVGAGSDWPIIIHKGEFRRLHRKA